MSTSSSPLGIMIHIPLDPDDEQGIDSESIAADRVSADTFRLRQSPFFAFDLALGDTVRAEKTAEGEWQFREVVSRSGHSTYRVYLEGDRAFRDEDVQQHWLPIAHLGGVADSANDRFFAVDIPPAADINAIYDLLESGERAGLWEFEEAHYEPAPDQP